MLFAFRFGPALSFALLNKDQKPDPAKLTPRGLVRTKDAPKAFPAKTELAAFAAGCFWGVEQEFRKQKGVLATAVGFMGGHTKGPSYEQVCEGNTGHAETVELEYDPKVITYSKLLDIFWHLHDPTTLNRQGPDAGEQYRSAIFYFTPEQKKLAADTRDAIQASGELSSKIVTEIVPASDFWKAEEYHQQYVEKGGHAGCQIRRPITRKKS
jgi:peptide-methionine (S)-S-oxide reductase